MNVLYGLDNNFVLQTATSMMSLCLNNKKKLISIYSHVVYLKRIKTN